MTSHPAPAITHPSTSKKVKTTAAEAAISEILSTSKPKGTSTKPKPLTVLKDDTTIPIQICTSPHFEPHDNLSLKSPSIDLSMDEASQYGVPSLPKSKTTDHLLHVENTVESHLNFVSLVPITSKDLSGQKLALLLKQLNDTTIDASAETPETIANYRAEFFQGLPAFKNIYQQLSSSLTKKSEFYAQQMEVVLHYLLEYSREYEAQEKEEDEAHQLATDTIEAEEKPWDQAKANTENLIKSFSGLMADFELNLEAWKGLVPPSQAAFFILPFQFRSQSGALFLSHLNILSDTVAGITPGLQASKVQALENKLIAETKTRMDHLDTILGGLEVLTNYTWGQINLYKRITATTEKCFTRMACKYYVGGTEEIKNNLLKLSPKVPPCQFELLFENSNSSMSLSPQISPRADGLLKISPPESSDHPMMVEGIKALARIQYALELEKDPKVSLPDYLGQPTSWPKTRTFSPVETKETLEEILAGTSSLLTLKKCLEANLDLVFAQWADLYHWERKDFP